MYIALFSPILSLFVYTVSGGYFAAPTRYDTWQDAKDYCESVNAQLATFDTLADWNAIHQQCKDEDGFWCWVGFNDIELDGNYEFVDGEAFIDLGVWRPGEPEQTVGWHCGMVDPQGKMAAGTCGASFNLGAICEDTCDNPCTEENIAAGNLYHPACSSCCHFIQCDAWGTAYEMPCAPGTYWVQSALTCKSVANSNGQCPQCPAAQSAAVHINPPIDNPSLIQHIGNPSKNIQNKYSYYGYISLIGVISFILINNIFIGCWCLGKGKNRNKAYAKCDMVGVNDEI